MTVHRCRSGQIAEGNHQQGAEISGYTYSYFAQKRNTPHQDVYSRFSFRVTFDLSGARLLNQSHWSLDSV